MTDTFARTLQSVLSGARQLEEFSNVLVSAAVEDALLCVARDFGHDYKLLLGKYKDDVVTRHAACTLAGKTQCRGTNAHNKPCTQRAVIQGYCRKHAAVVAEEESKRRRVEAYRNSVPRREDEGGVVRLWLSGLGERAPCSEYAVPAIGLQSALQLL